MNHEARITELYASPFTLYAVAMWKILLIAIAIAFITKLIFTISTS